MIHVALSIFVLHASPPPQADSCPRREFPWNDPVTLWSFAHHPQGPDPFSAAVSDSELYVVAEHTQTPAQLVNRARSRVLGIRVPLAGSGRSEVLLSPAGDVNVRYPRVAVDKSGVLHMIWQEEVTPPGRSADSGQTLILKTARYRNGRWSAPQQLATFERTTWSNGTPTDLVRTASGSLHMILSARRANESPAAVHVARSRGGWSVSRFSTPDPFSYGGLASRNDSLFLGLVRATFDYPGETGAVWFTMSPDDGAHWSAPVLVSRGYQLSPRQIRAVPLRSGPIALVWARQGQPDDFFSRAVWWAWSRDAGATWDAPRNASPSPRLWVHGAAAHFDGSIDMLLWSNDVMALAMLCGEEWGDFFPIPPARQSIGSGVLYQTRDGRTHVIWSAMARGDDGKPRRLWLLSTLR